MSFDGPTGSQMDGANGDSHYDVRLETLAPRYEGAQHGSYLQALIKGIETDAAANIALSGPYGVGKSSILCGLVQYYGEQTLQVSLATVRTSGRADKKCAALASTNDLQKEIVKQILYVVDPAKTPASRFPRTARFRLGRSLSWAVLGGLAGVALQWLITLTVAFARGSTNLVWSPQIYLPTFLAVGLLIFVLLRATNGRLTISDLSAGPAKLTLASANDSYFDDYLDEIVYFFQASKKRIVIFEDMDRFSNVKVFEDLRALNVLLNHAAQLKPRRIHRWRRGKAEERADLTPEELEDPKGGFHDGPIVFIYAIRDSLLASTVATSGVVAHDAFTRTKFFELIIPVVPFITEQNARGALKAELAGLSALRTTEPSATVGQATQPPDETQPSDALVRAIAQYFPDQRQIRNIRNEFSMYRAQLLRQGKHPAELTADRLLALILYKNLEVADFELIRFGTSKLNRVLELSRALRTENLERINLRLGHPSEEWQQARARDSATHVQKRADALGSPILRRNRGNALALDELSDLEIWRRVANGDADVTFDGRPLTRDMVEAGFDVSLSFADSVAVPLDATKRASLLADRDELEDSTWAKLWRAPQFTLGEGSTAWSENGTSPEARSFAQIVHAVLGEGLAADLIVDGHLTQNFALLSAHYDSAFLGIEAQNYVTGITEKAGRRPLDPISSEAIEQILAERTGVILERSGMVNVHVLNYVLLRCPKEAPRIIAQLRGFTDSDLAFLRDFLERYATTAPFGPMRDQLAYLAELAPLTVRFVAIDPSVPDGWRVDLFDSVITHVRSEDLPSIVTEDEGVREFAQQVHSRLRALTEDDAAASAAAAVLLQLQTVIDDIAPTSAAARAVLVPAGAFRMTMANLVELIGVEGGSTVSLEELKADPAAYSSTLNRVEEYLDMVEAGGGRESSAVIPVTADTPDGLVEVLTDVAVRDDEPELDTVLRRIGRRAASEIRVTDITGLDGLVQEALLAEDKAEASMLNLLARFKSAGELTFGAAHSLSVQPRPDLDDDDLTPFATEVLHASRTYLELLTPDVVGEFLAHAKEEVDLGAGAILAASPAVAVRVINDGVGDMTSLRTAATTDLAWVVRECLLASEPFPDAPTVERLLTPDDTEAFLESTLISDETKAMAPELAELLIGTEENANANANRIAEYLLGARVATDLPAIHLLARAGASRDTLIVLVVREPARSAFISNPGSTLLELAGTYAAIVNRAEGSPTFPDDPPHRGLLDLLQEIGVVTRRHVADGRLGIRRMA